MCLSGCAVRTFQPDDLAEVSALIHRTIDASYAGVYPPLAIAHFHEHHADYTIVAEAESGHIVVVERDGRMVATGTLVGDEVSRVYVEPERQGQGIGTAIMEALEARAREEGLTDVVLYASVVAKPFYDRLGYVVSEEGERDCGQGQMLRWYRMAKRLPP